jgi:hypothetical protein
VEDRLRRNSGLELEVGKAADPGQGVRDLARFGLELPLVRKILEAAAAARRIVHAGSLDAVGARLEHFDGDRLRVASLHLGDARSNGVAREAAPDEDDEAVQPRNAVTAVGERIDPELELLVQGNGGGHRSIVPVTYCSVVTSTLRVRGPSNSQKKMPW